MKLTHRSKPGCGMSLSPPMCHLPMNAVSYPAACRYCGKKVVPAGIGELLSTTRWRCAYWPVRIDARLGEHRAVVTNAFGSLTPRLARASMFGVSSQGCPALPIMSKRRSSTSTKITLWREAPGTGRNCSRASPAWLADTGIARPRASPIQVASEPATIAAVHQESIRVDIMSFRIVWAAPTGLRG